MYVIYVLFGFFLSCWWYLFVLICKGCILSSFCDCTFFFYIYIRDLCDSSSILILSHSCWWFFVLICKVCILAFFMEFIWFILSFHQKFLWIFNIYVHALSGLHLDWGETKRVWLNEDNKIENPMKKCKYIFFLSLLQKEEQNS